MTKRSIFPSKLGTHVRSTTTCMYKKNLSELRKMLILLIRSHCKMCVLPTIQSHVFVLFATDKHARSSCRRCAHFTIGTNEQNQHFAELRQKNMFVHTRSSAPKRFAKFGWQTRTFCLKKVAKVIAKLESDRLYHKYMKKYTAWPLKVTWHEL